MPLYQQQELHSPYSGVTTLHSPNSVYAQHSSISGSPPHATPYGSPHTNTGYVQPAYPQSTHARTPSWEHSQHSTVDTRYSDRGQPSPMAPSHPSYAPPQEVLYYPPPREAVYQTPVVSPASYGGYESAQYHDNISSPLSPPLPTSTMSTPTQFYARPAPIPGEGDLRYGDSLEPQRRPKYGRFVEVNHT